MFTDILFIVTTAFAFFGIYCLVETVVQMFLVAKFPPSVTVVASENEEFTYYKIKYIQENVPNNHTVLYSVTDTEKTGGDDVWLSKQIKDVLYVNNK